MSSLAKSRRALTDRRDKNAIPQLHCARRSVLAQNRSDAAADRQRQTDRAKCIKVASAQLTLVHISISTGAADFWAGQLQTLEREKNRTQGF
jgi:hypothetical protein